MNSPLVSICIPVFNGEKYLRECLDSAISQTYQNTEIIIVDDKSTDQTINIINEYARNEKRISLFINEINLGLVGNWNRCLECSNGEWIKFLFQDDLLHTECIMKMLELSIRESQFIVCNREFIFENVSDEIKDIYSNRILNFQKVFHMSEPGYISRQKISKAIARTIYKNFIGEPTAVMFRKEMVNSIGVFNPLLAQICDLEYWIRISSNYGLFYIPEMLASFRVHGESMSAVNRQVQRDLVDRIVLLYEYLNNPAFQKLRDQWSKFKRVKVFEMYKIRIYELNNFLKKTKDNDMLIRHYNAVKNAIPEIALYERSSLKTRLVWKLIELKRKYID